MCLRPSGTGGALPGVFLDARTPESGLQPAVWLDTSAGCHHRAGLPRSAQNPLLALATCSEHEGPFLAATPWVHPTTPAFRGHLCFCEGQGVGFHTPG